MSPPEGFRWITLQDRPELAERVFEIMTSTWPAFILNDAVGAAYWLELYIRFPQYQVLLTDRDSDDILGIANSLPLHFDGELSDLPDEGWSWAIRKGIEDSDAGIAPNFQCALAATVPVHHQGKALSPQVLKAMKSVGARYSLRGLLVPVRPSEKHQYPLIDFATYCGWTNERGEWFDLWLRTHQRLGAKVIKPCLNSLTVNGSGSDWQEWTGLRFPSSGEYTAARALVPVRYDAVQDIGTYVEPNLWMIHPI